MPPPIQDLEKQTRELHRILELTSMMAAERSLDALLRIIMEGASQILDADTTSIFLCDFNTGELYSRFIQQSGIKEIRFPMDKGIAGSVVTTGETINIANAYEDDRFNRQIDRQTGYDTRSILCMPLVSREGKTIGVTQALNKRQGPFTGHDEKLLGLFSLQAAASIENTLLHEEKEALFKSMIQTLSKTIDARDPVTAGHSQRVALYAGRLAAACNLDLAECYQMDVAAFLHDIGKIGVRDAVLMKPGRLTEEEFKKIQSHAAYTNEILEQIHFSRELEGVPFLAAAHHERLDGRGYPSGLKGDALPIAARIIAIADVYDALTAYDRPYKKAMPVEQALAILDAGKGSQFDPDLVDLFIRNKCYNIERRQHRRISISLEFEIIFPSKDDQKIYREQYDPPEVTGDADPMLGTKAPIDATREEEKNIRVKDISAGGMQFQTNYFFPVSDYVVLKILIREIDLSLVARLVRIRHRPVGTGYIMAVEFVSMSPTDRERLLSYLEQLSPDEQQAAIQFY